VWSVGSVCDRETERVRQSVGAVCDRETERMCGAEGLCVSERHTESA